MTLSFLLFSDSNIQQLLVIGTVPGMGNEKSRLDVVLLSGSRTTGGDTERTMDPVITQGPRGQGDESVQLPV